MLVRIDPSKRGINETAHAALGKLREEVMGVEHLLAPKAWRDLKAHLEAHLLTLLNPTLSSTLLISGLDMNCSENKSEKKLNSNISVSDLTLTEIFELLPDARQLVALVAAGWVQTQRKMLFRLKRDQHCLATLVPKEKRLRVTHIASGLSDPHGSGGTVTLLEFSGGSRLVYKPRSGDGEKLWFSALEWIDSQGFGAAFQLPGLRSRRAYCWMSYVERLSCLSRKSVGQFYWRWGAQAAVAQILGCADLHRQNWIASGEHPVLVDAEMIGYALAGLALPRRSSEDNLHPLLKTGLLPLSRDDGAGYYRDIAPFEERSVKKEPNTFWPLYTNRVHRPTSYKREIVEGFLAVSKFLESGNRRAGCLKFILRAAARTQVRILKRPTAQYYHVLHESLQPQHMLQVRQRLQFLLTRFGRDEVGSSEARSLLRGCIPRFTANLKKHPTRRKLLPSPRVMRDSAQLLSARLPPQYQIRGPLAL